MPTFVCAKCVCVDNTATSSYWSLIDNSEEIKFLDKDLEQYRGKPLCCVCARVVYNGGDPVVISGVWHNKFKREKATEDELNHTDSKGIIRYE